MFVTNNNTRRVKRSRTTHTLPDDTNNVVGAVPYESINNHVDLSKIAKISQLVDTSIGSHNSKGIIIYGGSNQPSNPNDRTIPGSTSAEGGVGVTDDRIANPPHPISFLGPGYLEFQNQIAIPSMRGNTELNGNLVVMGTITAETVVNNTLLGGAAQVISGDLEMIGNITKAGTLSVTSSSGGVVVEDVVFTGGAVTGATSLAVSGDVEVGSITKATGNLAISNTSGTVQVEDVVFTGGAITAATSLAVSGDIEVGSITKATGNLAISNTSGTVQVESAVFTGSTVTGVTNLTAASGDLTLSTASGNLLSSAVGTSKTTSTLNGIVESTAGTLVLEGATGTYLGAQTVESATYIGNNAATSGIVIGASQTTGDISIGTGGSRVSGGNIIIGTTVAGVLTQINAGNLDVNSGNEITIDSTTTTAINAGTTATVQGAAVGIVASAGDVSLNATGGRVKVEQVEFTTGSISRTGGDLAMTVDAGHSVTVEGWVFDDSDVSVSGSAGIASSGTLFLTGTNATQIGGGTLTVTNAGQSTSSTTGALKLTGGAGIVKDLFVGGKVDTDEISNASDVTVTAGGEIRLNPASGNAIIIDAAGANDSNNLKIGTSDAEDYCFYTCQSGSGGRSRIQASSITNGNPFRIENLNGDLELRSRLDTVAIDADAGPVEITGNTIVLSSNPGTTTVDGVTFNNNVMTAGAIAVSGTQQATSTTNASIKTAGGLGVLLDVLVGGKLYATATTASTGFNNGSIVTNGGVGVDGDIQLSGGVHFEQTGAGSNKASIIAPAAITTSYVLKLPVADGSSGQVLSTDGSGNLSWIDN